MSILNQDEIDSLLDFDAAARREEAKPKPPQADIFTRLLWERARGVRVEGLFFGRTVLSNLAVGMLAGRRGWTDGRNLCLKDGVICVFRPGEEPQPWQPTLEDLTTPDWECGD